MGFAEDLENKIREYMQGNYKLIELSSIPKKNNIAIGKKIYKTEMTTFSIDLRKSSELLFQHHQQTIGKIHKAFLTTISETIRYFGGKIRDFQGDSVLAFWGTNDHHINNAVKAGMVVKWLINTKFKEYFNQYEDLDFGIGIDWGKVFIIRAGITNDSNSSDLVYLGKSVNLAVSIANQASSPYNVEISEKVYSRLDDNHLYNENENMWEYSNTEWNNREFTTCKTIYYWEV